MSHSAEPDVTSLLLPDVVGTATKGSPGRSSVFWPVPCSRRRPVVGHKNRHRLGEVHRATAAHGNDDVGRGLSARLQRLVHQLRGRERGHLVEQSDAALTEQVEHTLEHPCRPHAVPPGHQERPGAVARPRRL